MQNYFYEFILYIQTYILQYEHLYIYPFMLICTYIPVYYITVKYIICKG